VLATMPKFRKECALPVVELWPGPSPARDGMEATMVKAANLSVWFRSSTKSGVPADSVESGSVEEALSLTSTGLALTSTGLEVSLVCPGTAAYVETRPYGAFQAADWPRLPEARGSLEHDQALRPPVSQLAEV